MASTVKIKRSSVAGKKPTTSDISAGELALNTKDFKLFSSNGSTIFELANAGALANTNLRINLINTNLTGTNTALRTLISDRLQVSNAATIYQTKAVERAALANTNARINLINTNLTGTNTSLRTLISDRLQVANASTLYATKSNPTTSGLLAHTGRVTISTNLAVSGNTTLGAAGKFVNIPGSLLQLNGTDIRATFAANSYVKTILANTNSYIATRASWTALTSTNTALRTLISDRLQVANAATIYQTKAVERAALANTNARINLINTNLTGTNTALRTLISDRLQVSNASATYQTKAVERAALANTNLRINLINTNLTGTNTSLRTLISDRLQVANASTLYTTKSNPTTSGLLAHTGRATISTNLAVTGNTTIAGLKANNTLGTAGQVLKTNGTTVYWDVDNSGGSGGLVSTTTAIVKNLTQNDVVVTGVTAAVSTNYLQVANAVATYATKSNPTTSGLLAHTGRATISTNLDVTGNTAIAGLRANNTLGTADQVLKTNGTTVYWGTAAGGGGSSANGFSGILVGANVIAADSSTDRLTLTAGSKISLAANPTTDTITIQALTTEYLQVANAVSTYATKRAAVAYSLIFGG